MSGELVRHMVQNEIREDLARWMVQNSFATGHGDSIGSLLADLTWQVELLRQRVLQAESLRTRGRPL
jgi:hypothetical protein